MGTGLPHAPSPSDIDSRAEFASELAQRYRDEGMSVHALAAEYGISYSKAYYLLQMAGARMRRRGGDMRSAAFLQRTT